MNQNKKLAEYLDIWITTFYRDGEEPVVSVFDNKQGAEDCKKLLSGKYEEKNGWKYCIDKAVVLHGVRKVD